LKNNTAPFIVSCSFYIQEIEFRCVHLVVAHCSQINDIIEEFSLNVIHMHDTIITNQIKIIIPYCKIYIR